MNLGLSKYLYDFAIKFNDKIQLILNRLERVETIDLVSKADLVGGKIPTSQIPSVAIVEFLGAVSNENQMLSLTGQSGDWCIRSDKESAYVCTGETSLLTNWIKIPTPQSPVNSINNQVGDVILGKQDIGLGNVPNIDFSNIINFQDIGIFNPNNSTATVQGVAVVLSSIPPNWLNGQYVTCTTSGNIGFSGVNFLAGTALKQNDRLRKNGNSWELLPATLSLNSTFKTNNVNFVADGISHPFVNTTAVINAGTVLKIKLIGANNIKYAFQVRNTSNNYPVLATNLISNTDYEIELTQDINLLGVSELTSNLVAGTVYLSVEVYSYLYDSIYRNKKDISSLSSTQLNILNDLSFLNSNLVFNKDAMTLITNKRLGFKILSSFSIDYIDKSIQSMFFYSYHSNIKRLIVSLNVVVANSYIEFKYELVSNRDVSYSGSFYVTGLSIAQSAYWVSIGKYGLCKIQLNYNYLISNPTLKFRLELDINTSIDVDDVVFDNDLDFGQKEWIPTVSSGIVGNLNYAGIPLVQNNSNFQQNKNTLAYSGLYWHSLQPNDSGTIDEIAVFSALSSSLNGGYKQGLLILPSTMPYSVGGNTLELNGETVYYRFPTWLYNAVNNQVAGVGVYKPTIEPVTDYQTGLTIKVMFLDYRDLLTQNFFKNAIDLLYSFFHNSNQGIIYYKYVDFLKVGIFGKWGEGSTWNNIPDWNTLITMSDYVVNKFSDKICLQPMSPILQSSTISYPSTFKDYLAGGVTANNVNFGLFVDNLGKFQDRYRENPNFEESYYQKIYRLHEKAPIYGECWQYLPDKNFFQTELPFRRLVSEIMMYRPHWLSVSNLFFQNNLGSSEYVINMIKKVSCLIGTKVYLQNNRTAMNQTNNQLSIWFCIGLLGTSKIYHSYWKLRITITDTVNTETFILNFDLRTLKPAFNIGVPNWRETSAIIQDLVLTKTYSNQVSVMVEIIDIDSILLNMFINKENKYYLI